MVFRHLCFNELLKQKLHGAEHAEKSHAIYRGKGGLWLTVWDLESRDLG